MRKIKILSLIVACILVASALASCGNAANGGDDHTSVSYQPIDEADVIGHKDHTSVYDKIGKRVTIDMVREDEKGVATAVVDGVSYTLGMDFLSMAMVYNTTPPENSERYKTAEDVYNEWWRLYIQRWNRLVPEIPLYSNQYFDLYNAKIEGFVTSPYFGPAEAIVSATVAGKNTQVILGSSTKLSGAFRNASFGKSSPGAGDLDIESLTSGHATVQTDRDGTLVWNTDALDGIPQSVIHENGTLTYTVKIRKGLKFSDGSAIRAEHYIAPLLALSSPVAVECGETGTAGLRLVGFQAFNAYKGEGKPVYFEGIRLLDDYTFSVTFTPDYADYYYTMSYASFSPAPLSLYLGDGAIVVDPVSKSCALNSAFYEKEHKDSKTVYKTAAKIRENLKWSSPLPWSGPYVLSHFDEASLTATMTLNPYYTKDLRGKATIDKIVYLEVVPETQLDMFKKGQVDVIAGITGGEETKAALSTVAESKGAFKETHYDRAGYGKLAFRCDFGPTGMSEVRQAIMYTINRPEFASAFTGGYGSVVDGPYYTGSAAYMANAGTLKLNKYTYSSDSAIRVLEEGGWVYNKAGERFDPDKDLVRYKKLSGYELSRDNLYYKSIDGKYKTVKIDGSYYMPLAINYYGTQPNTVTDQLITAWQKNPAATSQIGMYITYVSCDFVSGLYAEYTRSPEYGYDGTPKLSCINFATGFNSAIYDQAFYWTLNPEYYEVYSNNYLQDEADFWENYVK